MFVQYTSFSVHVFKLILTDATDSTKNPFEPMEEVWTQSKMVRLSVHTVNIPQIGCFFRRVIFLDSYMIALTLESEREAFIK